MLLLFGKIGRANVYHAAHHPAGAELIDKLYRPLKCLFGVNGLNALYEPGGGIGNVMELPCGGTDVFGAEHGAFEQSCLGVLGYFAVKTAHYARYAHALFGIGNKQHIRAHHALLAVKRIDRLALGGVPYHDMVIGNARKIEGVHGMTVFNEHEVCDIDYIVDGP